MKGLVLLAALASYQPPKGYDASKTEKGADAVVSYVKGSHRLSVRLYGAEGSAYRDAKAFLASAGAVARGKEYERAYVLPAGDPNSPGAGAVQAVERLAIVPADGGRFFVLGSAWESAVPDLSGGSEKAWKAFRAGFRVRTPASSGTPRRGR